MRPVVLFAAVMLVTASCSDSETTTPTETAAASTVTTQAVATTIAPVTTTIAPTTTTASAAMFGSEDLGAAVLKDGDPWTIEPTGVFPLELTIDDIWPLDSETSDFSDERAIYEAEGFEAGSFAFFEEADGSGLLLTGAHLFATPEGAAAALDVIEASFSDVDLVAAITGLPAGALTAVEQSDTGLLGDRDAAVVLTGDVFQVVGYVWITGNLLQFVRASMALGDPFREEAALLVAFGMADRTGG